MSKKILAFVGVIVSVALLVTSTALAEYEIISVFGSVIMLTFSVASVFVAIFFAAKVEYETGVYECRKCGNTFKPTFKAYIFGTHTIKTRRLKCPGCGEKTWCIRKSDTNA